MYTELLAEDLKYEAGAKLEKKLTLEEKILLYRQLGTN